jgi:hypothetical protein
MGSFPDLKERDFSALQQDMHEKSRIYGVSCMKRSRGREIALLPAGHYRGRQILPRGQLGLNNKQFLTWIFVDLIQPVGAMIPIAGIAEVAFDFVQHGMNPRGDSIVFVLLHQIMCSVPIAGLRQFNCFQEFIVRNVHGLS